MTSTLERGGEAEARGGLGKSESDIVRELRKGGCAKMRTRRSKLKKFDNFADVKNGRPLTVNKTHRMLSFAHALSFSRLYLLK